MIEEKLNNLLEKEKNYDYLNAEIPFGFSFNCFINQDNDFKILMNLMSDNIIYFNKLFIQIYKNNLINELTIINDKIESIGDKNEKRNLIYFHKSGINSINKNLETSSLSEYINRYSCNLIEEIYLPYSKDYPIVMNRDYIKKYEPLYSAVKIIFEDYKKKTTPFINFQEIEAVKNELIDIYFPDNYIDKYNLLKFSNFHNLYLSYKEGSHIADYEKQKYFYNHFIPTIIFEIIENLLDNKYINDVSFLITYISNNIICLEEKEYGREFNYDLKQLPNLSSFYDEESIDNKLIVKKQQEDSKISLTFETLKNDFISQDEYVITNLIHLEIESIDKEEFITHLDHEFIFYTLDDYEKKLDKYSIKGSKKLKTFKIDNSRIPLKYNYKNYPILIYFIMELLDNKDLVIEYFSKIDIS
ncbi:hypothetical protein NG749_00765 [Aliarcobacter cryaerophilus]